MQLLNQNQILQEIKAVTFSTYSLINLRDACICTYEYICNVITNVITLVMRCNDEINQIQAIPQRNKQGASIVHAHALAIYCTCGSDTTDEETDVLTRQDE